MTDNKQAGNEDQGESYLEYLDQLKVDNQDLYDHIINNGKTESEALDMLIVLDQQREDYMQDSIHVEVPRVIPMSDILKHTDWGNMNTTQKKGLLWNLGIDTKKHDFHYRDQRIRDSNKEVVLTGVVWGKERLDKEWINTKHPTTGGLYASEEAVGLAYTKEGKGFWC